MMMIFDWEFRCLVSLHASALLQSQSYVDESISSNRSIENFIIIIILFDGNPNTSGHIRETMPIIA